MPRRTKTPEQHQIVADRMAKGDSIKDALLAGGYSPKQANKGLAKLPKGVLSAMSESSRVLIEKGKTVNKEDLKHLLLGGLVQNIECGEDKAHQSLKMIGSLKEVAAFEKDSVAGVVVIEYPRGLPSLDDCPTLDVTCEPLQLGDGAK